MKDEYSIDRPFVGFYFFVAGRPHSWPHRPWSFAASVSFIVVFFSPPNADHRGLHLRMHRTNGLCRTPNPNSSPKSNQFVH